MFSTCSMPLPYHRCVRRVKQLALAAGAVLGALAYVWVAAVRAVPGVRRRKAEASARRRVPRA
jgi:hypothetical protein